MSSEDKSQVLPEGTPAIEKLNAAGINTIDELIKFGPLEEIKGIGKKTTEEIQEFFKDYFEKNASGEDEEKPEETEPKNPEEASGEIQEEAQEKETEVPERLSETHRRKINARRLGKRG